jgi:hypothetical protein
MATTDAGLRIAWAEASTLGGDTVLKGAEVSAPGVGPSVDVSADGLVQSLPALACAMGRCLMIWTETDGGAGPASTLACLLPTTGWAPMQCLALPALASQPVSLAADGPGWLAEHVNSNEVQVARLDPLGSYIGDTNVLNAVNGPDNVLAVSGPDGVMVSAWLDRSTTRALGVTQVVGGVTFSPPDYFVNGNESPLGMAPTPDAVELAWCDGTAHAVRFSDAGMLTGSAALSPFPGCLTNPSVAFDGQRFVAIWSQSVDAGLSKLVGTELDTAGVPSGVLFDVPSGDTQVSGVNLAAFAPGRFAVLYTQGQIPLVRTLFFEVLSYGAGAVGATCSVAADCSSFACVGGQCSSNGADGGVVDAGHVMGSDGGATAGQDGGHSSEPDGGARPPDGGAVLPDGGSPALSEGRLAVACGCTGGQSGPVLPWLAFALMMRRRRPWRP